jgi:hypothetical protein
MKKYYLILVFIFILMIVSSCSAQDVGPADEAVDGLSFDYFATYEIDGTNYEVYLSNEISDSLYYTHVVSDISSKSAYWTVNFMYEAIYHVEDWREDKEIWKQLYNHLLSNQEYLEEKCGFDVLLFDPYESVELEYTLKNETKEEASYVIFNTYLPIRLVNENSGVRITVGIPVNMDLLLKIGDKVEDPFSDKMMSWEDFLAI